MQINVHFFCGTDNAVINVWDKQTKVPTDILYVQTADKFVEWMSLASCK